MAPSQRTNGGRNSHLARSGVGTVTTNPMDRPGGETWNFPPGTPGLNHQLKAAIAKHDNKRLCTKASQHYHGEGLEQGAPCWDAVRYAHKACLAEGGFSQAKAVLQLATGGVCVAERWNSQTAEDVAIVIVPMVRSP